MAASTAGDGAGPGAPSGASEAAGAEVAGIARAGEPDRYLAALLAPSPQREALLALAAFSAELARIPLRVVREPFMGEIRLEWWRTALASPQGASAGHSVADDMRASVRRYDLPVALLDGLIDARAQELGSAPFADDAAVHSFLWRTEGALFALGSRVLGMEADSEVQEAACAAAGRAYGLARLLLGLPRSLSLGRVPLAQTRVATAGLTRDELLAGATGAKVEALMEGYLGQIRSNFAEARRLTQGLPRQQRLTFLPLALVGPYVRVLERQGGGALREEADILPLTRVLRIATAYLFGRL